MKQVTDLQILKIEEPYSFEMSVEFKELHGVIFQSGFDPGSGQVEFVVDKVALGQVFSEYFGFPCQTSFHQLLHNHPHLSSGAGTIGQNWSQYKGLSPTPLATK
jgi:hypothetical protein